MSRPVIPQTRRTFLAGTAAAGMAAVVAPYIHAAGKGPRIKSAVRREETVIRYGGNGDNWLMSWAADDRQYTGLCDGVGFVDRPKLFHNSRMLAISGGPQEARFHDLPGYPTLARPVQRREDARYYNFGTLALNGHLYQFMSTFNRPIGKDEVKNPKLGDLVRFNGAKLIYSPDNGRTWHNQNRSTPVVWEDWKNRSRDTMVFFDEDQEAFSLLSILQMGKNYEHNRDGYIYVYAPNGNTEGTMNELVMFRVLKAQLLNRDAYEYFSGLQGGNATWSKDILSRKPAHTFPRGWVNKLVHPYSWQPSVVYNPGLGLYMMANWGIGSGTGVDAFSGETADDLWFVKPSYLGFWVAQNPWGPWTQIHEETAWNPAGDASARAYQPQIAPKWIAPDGKSFWLVWTDFQVTDVAAMNRQIKEDELAGSPDAYTEADVARSAARMRKYMPYYAFNVQRVDLVWA